MTEGVSARFSDELAERFESFDSVGSMFLRFGFAKILEPHLRLLLVADPDPLVRGCAFCLLRAADPDALPVFGGDDL